MLCLSVVGYIPALCPTHPLSSFSSSSFPPLLCSGPRQIQFRRHDRTPREDDSVSVLRGASIGDWCTVCVAECGQRTTILGDGRRRRRCSFVHSGPAAVDLLEWLRRKDEAFAKLRSGGIGETRETLLLHTQKIQKNHEWTPVFSYTKWKKRKLVFTWERSPFFHKISYVTFLLMVHGGFSFGPSVAQQRKKNPRILHLPMTPAIPS